MRAVEHGERPQVRVEAQEPSDKGLLISQWCPKGSTIRPMRQAYSLQTGQTTVAPAATARAKAASGSSTVITIRADPPPRDSGLKLKCSGDSSANQNSAAPADNRATRSTVVVMAKQFASSERRLIELIRPDPVSNREHWGYGGLLIPSALREMANRKSPLSQTSIRTVARWFATNPANGSPASITMSEAWRNHAGLRNLTEYSHFHSTALFRRGRR
jgi:hypothetical protein